MAFLLFKQVDTNFLSKKHEVRLAGYNAIYKQWEKQGKPLNKGWHITISELISTLTDSKEEYPDNRLLIDFHPTAKWRIGLVEVLDIYLYTYGNTNTKEASWTPLMLRLRDCYYEERDVVQDEKEKLFLNLPIPEEGEDIFTFLYLTGPWNWGKVGMVSGAFIHQEAKNYFKQFFI